MCGCSGALHKIDDNMREELYVEKLKQPVSELEETENLLQKKNSGSLIGHLNNNNNNFGNTN